MTDQIAGLENPSPNHFARDSVRYFQSAAFTRSRIFSRAVTTTLSDINAQGLVNTQAMSYELAADACCCCLSLPINAVLSAFIC